VGVPVCTVCGVPATPEPDALVLRFPPGGADEVQKIRKEAKYVHRHHQSKKVEPWYRLSVWADVSRPSESTLELKGRLVKAAGLAGIRLDDERNDRFWWTTAARIYEAGFTFRKDEEPGEPQEHYSVDLGSEEPTRETIEVFVRAFQGQEETGHVR
jgi:hypothetical protein